MKKFKAGDLKVIIGEDGRLRIDEPFVVAVTATEQIYMRYAIWQWGRKLFTGSKKECREVKKRWSEQHGNIELEIIPEKANA